MAWAALFSWSSGSKATSARGKSPRARVGQRREGPADVGSAANRAGQL